MSLRKPEQQTTLTKRKQKLREILFRFRFRNPTYTPAKFFFAILIPTTLFCVTELRCTKKIIPKQRFHVIV